MIGGYTSASQGVYSIERLNVVTGLSSWEIYELPDCANRLYPMVSPINDGQILIAGGQRSTDLSDAFLLNLSDMTSQKVIDESLLSFKSLGCAAMHIPGQVICIGKNFEEQRFVVLYDAESNTLNKLHNF